MNKFIMLVGLPGSGKSTWIKENKYIYNIDIIHSSDNIREELGDINDQSKNTEVFNILHYRIKRDLEKELNVCMDATNISRKHRADILRKISYINCDKICIIMATKYVDCIFNDQKRNRKVGEEVITRMMSNFEIPFKEEGWTEIKIISPYTNGDKTYLDKIFKSMQNFNQMSPYHTQMLGDHCKFVAHQFNSYGGFQLGAMLHDIGKLKSQTFDNNGIAHYYNHSNIGCYELLTHYNDVNKCLEEFINIDTFLDCLFLVNYHMFPMNWNTDKAKEKWKNIFGEYYYDLLLTFNKCDKMRPDDKNKSSEL